MSNYGEIDLMAAPAAVTVVADLDLGVQMIDETVARIPYCSVKIPYCSVRIPYCSLKLNAKDARVLMAL
jgi:hypothetical protein